MASSPLLAGFDTQRIDTGETEIFIRRRGSGAPVLLLHGFPQTHLMWHRVAPALAERFTVICADLRGYGASGKPPSAGDHAPYAKAAMARDLVRLMERLGFERFALAGHDRGGRVAYRLALDHPDRVTKLAVLDVIPTGEAWRRADHRLALGFWPWSLLAQPAPLPERLIAGDPAAVVDAALGGWGSDAASFPAEVRAAYVAALADPAAAHAICEEYRAAATLDFGEDERDRRAGRRIACPALALWAAGGSLDTWYAGAGGPLAIWRDWCADVSGHAIDGGHFFPEQNPEATIAALAALLAAERPGAAAPR